MNIDAKRELSDFDHKQLSVFRDLLAEFADEPYRQTEYKICELVIAWLNETVAQETRKAYKEGYARGGVDEILRHEAAREAVEADLKAENQGGSDG